MEAVVIRPKVECRFRRHMHDEGYHRFEPCRPLFTWPKDGRCPVNVFPVVRECIGSCLSDDWLRDVVCDHWEGQFNGVDVAVVSVQIAFRMDGLFL